MNKGLRDLLLGNVMLSGESSKHGMSTRQKLPLGNLSRSFNRRLKLHEHCNAVSQVPLPA